MKDFFGKFTLDVIATCAFGVESNSMIGDGGFASRVSNFASLSIMKRLMLYFILLFMPGIARFVPLSFFNMEVIHFLANVIKEAKNYRNSTGQKYVFYSYLYLSFLNKLRRAISINFNAYLHKSLKINIDLYLQ